MSWEELQPRFRAVVLSERRAGRTLEEIAEASHLGRRTVCRLIAKEIVNPRLAVRECVERFVDEACQKARSNGDTDGE